MIAALVPAKALDHAKRRLAALLTDSERRRLALAMLEDVIKALQAVSRIDSVSIVSPDADVLKRASELGAEAVQEPPSVRGINQALTFAAHVIATSGPDALLVILADVPAVTPGDIETAIDALPTGKGVAICPSHDKGTSLLLLRPPGVIPFRFGPHSFPAHKREAAARGLHAEVVRLDSLAHDIDDPADLRQLLAQPAPQRSGAERSSDIPGATHRLLATLDVAGRLPSEPEVSDLQRQPSP